MKKHHREMLPWLIGGAGVLVAGGFALYFYNQSQQNAQALAALAGVTAANSGASSGTGASAPASSASAPATSATGS